MVIILKVVVLGGGGGIKPIIEGLKNFYELTAIVTVFDDGGSTGKLRDYCGLGVGDMRNALIAISREDDDHAILREILAYRFEGNHSVFYLTPIDLISLAAREMNFDEHNANRVRNVAIERFERNKLPISASMNIPVTTRNHPVGNLILCFLIMTCRDGWVEIANDIFSSRGKVYPNTVSNCRLVASFDGFHDVVGESYFDNPDLRIPPIRGVDLNPPSHAYPPSLQSIIDADYVIIAPGSFYASIIASVLPIGMIDVLSSKPIIWYANLFYDLNQTLYRIPEGDREKIVVISPETQAKILERYLGKRPDLIIAQDPSLFPTEPDILERYKRELGMEDIMPNYDGVAPVYLTDLARLDYTQMNRGPDFVFRHDPNKVLKSFRNAIAEYNL
ncbi:MAG: 2-phospho-L-lactate transferase CofD family protein [Candidatus Aenigmatarchaeota archaeon]